MTNVGTKCGNYSGSGKNPLADSNLVEDDDKHDKSPKYKDYAGGMSAPQPGHSLKYVDGNAPTPSKNWK